MVSSADLLDLEPVESAPDAPPEAITPRLNLVFRPEVFFLGRTEGAGVVRDPLGRVIRSCRITTKGALIQGRDAIRLEEEFVYDDGEVDLWRWAMSPGRDGRYVAAEARAGAGLTGERRGSEYYLTFRRPMGRAKGPFSPRFTTRFTLLSPELAVKRANISLLGAPLGSLTAVHRRTESDSPRISAKR
jgi:uncharacterized protein DUF3833